MHPGLCVQLSGSFQHYGRHRLKIISVQFVNNRVVRQCQFELELFFSICPICLIKSHDKYSDSKDISNNNLNLVDTTNKKCEKTAIWRIM